jgi:hypothetical protein
VAGDRSTVAVALVKLRLTAKDLADHEKLGITPELLDRAGVHRVDHQAGRQLLCCGGRSGDMAGIAYPYVSPRLGRVVTHRVRRDHPEIDNGKPKGKYLCPAGGRRYLYFVPGVADLLDDVSVPVVLVEAEKSALALTAAGDRVGRRVLLIATGGCYGWRGKIGKIVGADGVSIDEKGVLPDFDLVAWHGRDVVIIFDANVVLNVNVQNARRELARELTRRGARVRTVNLPGAQGINGPDDFVGVHGDAALFALVDGALPAEGGVQLEDFWAHMPSGSFIFEPTGDFWPGSSVNTRIAGTSITRKDGKVETLPATVWLARNRPVEASTWAPGQPKLIRDRLIADGGWIERPGCNTFNLYRPPHRPVGDPNQADPWLGHLRFIYPADADHIVLWLAHRVQRPGEKINHALVLGGHQGIGKDSLLEPLKLAVGPWNFLEVTPEQLVGRFNGFLKSVILRISEARDLGDVDRYAFYEHIKPIAAAPPDVLRCDEKHLREHYLPNVTGVIITTNYKSGGLYLPADDRRHYVAWSERSKDDFNEEYWLGLWHWFLVDGGLAHVVAFLESVDLTGFNPKAIPKKTPAFWDIVDSNRAPEDAELADALDKLGRPAAVTLEVVASVAAPALAEWLRDHKSRRQVPHRMETAGYVSVRNDGAKDGYWSVDGRRQAIYVRAELPLRDRIVAAQELTR